MKAEHIHVVAMISAYLCTMMLAALAFREHTGLVVAAIGSGILALAFSDKR